MCFVDEISVLNLETLTWSHCNLVNHNQMQRSSHSTALTTDNNKIYIFGGIDTDFALCNTM